MRPQHNRLVVFIDWLQFSLASLATAGLVLDTFDIFSLPFLSSSLPAITLGFVFALILTSFLERRVVLHRIEKTFLDEYGLGERLRRLGVRNVYPDRDTLPKLEDFLGDAKHDVLIVGITLRGLTTRHRGLFDRKIESGCSFRFLLPSSLPDRSELAHLADEVTLKGTQNDLQTSFDEIAGLAGQASLREGKPAVELRVFDFLPTMGVIFRDADKRAGTIRLELYPCTSSELSDNSEAGLMERFPVSLQRNCRQLEMLSAPVL